MLERPTDRSVATETAEREQRLGFDRRARRTTARIDGFAADLTAAQVAALRADPEVAMVVPDRPVRSQRHRRRRRPGGTVAPGIRRVDAGARRPPSARAPTAPSRSSTPASTSTTPTSTSPPARTASTPGARPTTSTATAPTSPASIGARNNGSRRRPASPPARRSTPSRSSTTTATGSTATILCGAEWVLANAAAKNITVANFSLGGPGGASTCANDPEHQRVLQARHGGHHAGRRRRQRRRPTSAHPPPRGPGRLPAGADRDGDDRHRRPARRRRRRRNVLRAHADERYAELQQLHDPRRRRRRTSSRPPASASARPSPGGGTVRMSGTSMAAPHVAGLVALCKGEARRRRPVRRPDDAAGHRAHARCRAALRRLHRRQRPLCSARSPSCRDAATADAGRDPVPRRADAAPRRGRHRRRRLTAAGARAAGAAPAGRRRRRRAATVVVATVARASVAPRLRYAVRCAAA